MLCDICEFGKKNRIMPQNSTAVLAECFNNLGLARIQSEFHKMFGCSLLSLWWEAEEGN
jgi:hypothetical protein